MRLRNFQRQAVDSVFSEWQDALSTLIVSPTGSGKTAIASFIIKRAFPRKAMFIVHREELAMQAQKTIERITGFHVEIEMGERRVDFTRTLMGQLPQVVVASVQTLTAGGDGKLSRLLKFDPQMFGILMIDEAHHCTSNSYRRIVSHFQQNESLRMVGFTATPDRADEAALGQVFETVAMDYEIMDAIRDGWLVPVEQQMVQVGSLDFSGIHTVAGDLNGGELADVMEQERNLHGVASPSLEIIGKRRALLFAASVKQSMQLCEIFNRHPGTTAAHVDGGTDKLIRSDIFRKFSAGEVQILCNVGIATEGWDDGAHDGQGVQVVIMARPTKSRALYAQCVGRALRPLPGMVDQHEQPEARRAAITSSAKPAALVVDFVGNAGRHKLISSADILGGKNSEEAVTRAKAKAAKEKTNMGDALAEADAEIAAEKEAAAKRAALIGRAKYTTTSISPFDVFGLTPMQPRQWDAHKQLSEKQQALLQRQGVDPMSMSYTEGKQLISEMVRRWDSGLCSLKQAKLLKRHGLDPNVTREEASRQIDEIARTHWRKAV